MGSEASSFNPVSASPAESVLKPSSPRFSSSRRRILASSSMIRIVGMWLARVGTNALARSRRDSRPRLSRRAELGSYLRFDGLFERKEKCKYSAALRRVLDMDRPMMTVHDLRYDGKAQSYASLLRGHKRVENLFAQLVGHAGTSVGKAQFHAFLIIPCSKLNTGPQRAAVVLILHGFVGVLHEIEEGLLAQAFVKRNERQSAGVVALYAHGLIRLGLGIETPGDNLQHAIEKRGQVRGLPLRMQRTSE